MITIILTFISISGCTSSEFKTSYEQYKKAYVSATSFVEKDNDPLKALEKMDLKLFKAELNKMKIAIDSMSTQLKSKHEKGIYGNVENEYKGLQYLLYAKDKFKDLSIQEKRKVYIEASMVISARDKYEESEKR